MTAVTVAPLPNGAATVPAGVVRVRERVIEKVVREISAVTVGVPRREVNVEVVERYRGLAIRVEAKLPIPNLDDTEAVRLSTPVVERVRALQSELAAQFARVTGRDIERVSFTVTGAVLEQRKRVK